jgi:hypothetical protein
MWGQSDENGVADERACFGVINPSPALVGADGERLPPESNERCAAKAAAQARKDLTMRLQLKVKALPERHRDPKKQDCLPSVLGGRSLVLRSNIGGNEGTSTRPLAKLIRRETRELRGSAGGDNAHQSS